MKFWLGLSTQRRAIGWLAMAWLAILQACSTSNIPTSGTSSPPVVSPPSSGTSASQARNAKDYRRDAARHLYALQSERIYKGRLPPMLYAVGVLNIDIDHRGQVQGLHWMRAPKHAPEVMAEIEKMVRAAAPYPAPQHMAKVTYTDVWLWHKSGQFQLDTLTEGQD